MEGFFIGPIIINAVATEAMILMLYLLFLLVTHTREKLMLTVLFATAVVFPIHFYHHTCSLWLALDHRVERLPMHAPPRGPWQKPDREMPC